MGEYVEYKGEEIKLGTCEHLYYASYVKYLEAFESGQLKQAEYGSLPEIYLDKAEGFLWRFPFPDEDDLDIGMAKDHNKCIPVLLTDPASAGINGVQVSSSSGGYLIEIARQKLVEREIDGKTCLVLVYRDPQRGGQYYRVENDPDIRYIVQQLVRHHMICEVDEKKRALYRQVAQRILKGYRIGDWQARIRQNTHTKIHDIEKPSKQFRRSQSRGF